jgi:hypothetical protein
LKCFREDIEILQKILNENLMKLQRFYVVAALSLLNFMAFSQDSLHADKTNYLFKIGKIHHLGLYVAPEFTYGSLAGGFTPMGGASAMLLINKKFGIGITGYGTFGDYTPTKVSSKQVLQLNAEFGGVKLEYTPNPNSAVHVTFGVMGGMGMAQIDSANSETYRKKGDRFGRGNDFFGKNGSRGNSFAVIQPSINLEANLFRFAKIFAGVSYRITSGGTATFNSTTILSNSDLMGVNLSVGAKIGFFDYTFHKREHRRGKKS